MTALLALALAPLANAQDCDVAALQAAYKQASPVAVAKTWTDLARCDEAAGRKLVNEAFSKMLAGDGSNEAVVLATGMGAGDAIRAWMLALEPSHRSKTIAHLGTVCTDDESVRAFFFESVDALGDDFWEDRWYRGLTDCRVDDVRALLTEQVDARASASGAQRSQLLGVLEAYARNLRADAIPKLTELGGTLDNDDELVMVVSAFGDAANVGSEAGVDPKIASQASAAIVALGPTLPARGVDQARTILLSLGDEQASDHMAVHRWRERIRDGAYDYAVAVTEQVTCKNGKTQAWLHTAPVREAGEAWPDQLEEQLQDQLVAAWGLDTAERCKGTGTITLALPETPFESEAGRDTWIDDQAKAFRASAAADKSGVQAREPFSQ